MKKIKMNKKNKHAQEEIVGFIIIIAVVSIILLFFLGFYLKGEKKESVESYESNSFIQAFLQYTTECRDYLEYLSIKDLIFECDNGASCLDGQEACEVLDSTLERLIRESWLIGENRPVKGYKLNITADNQKEIVSFTQGNITKNYKGARQDFTKGGETIDVVFRAYS